MCFSILVLLLFMNTIYNKQLRCSITPSNILSLFSSSQLILEMKSVTKTICWKEWWVKVRQTLWIIWVFFWLVNQEIIRIKVGSLFHLPRRILIYMFLDGPMSDWRRSESFLFTFVLICFFPLMAFVVCFSRMMTLTRELGFYHRQWTDLLPLLDLGVIGTSVIFLCFVCLWYLCSGLYWNSDETDSH